MVLRCFLLVVFLLIGSGRIFTRASISVKFEASIEINSLS